MEDEEVEDVFCPDDTFNDQKANTESLAAIHAVATFEKCTNGNLCQDDINSLMKFIHSEEHLARNVTQTETEQIDKWEVAVKMLVLTNNLWESPRSYIWKHLGGQNFWDRSNGTKIKLVRIHVK